MERICCHVNLEMAVHKDSARGNKKTVLQEELCEKSVLPGDPG